MPEQVQKIGTRILEWWKKFNTKQKALLLSIVATLIIALVILAAVVSKPTMVPLIDCATMAQAGEVKKLLDDNGYKYELSQDGLSFSVDAGDKALASILLGENEIPASGPDISKVFDGGFSSTEADKAKRYKLYLEQYYAEQLAMLSNVESASVTLDIKPDDGTIIAREEEAHAAVILSLKDDMNEDQASGIAKYIATQLGNKNTDNILILDSNSNVLFSGGESDSVIGTASSQLSVKAKAENQVKSKVKDVMIGSSLFDHVEVAPELVMDFSQSHEVSHEYSAPDGRTDGMIGSKSEYESSSKGGAAAAPGTDSNDDSSYVIQDENYTESNVTDTTTNYQNNEKVKEYTSAGGVVDYGASSVSVVATKYVIYKEETLKASGALDDMTFDEYIATNSAPVKTEVDPEYYTMVANATGFAEDNITIIAQEEPVFQYASGGRSASDYLQIVLVVLILLLLGYVVFRSTRKEKEVELEPEIELEQFLDSAKEEPEENPEDIGFKEKSETRIRIEQFVEENPEAAASLLRNWLNEEWE